MVPDVPVIPKFVNVATPLTAFLAAVPTAVPPLNVAATDVLAETVLPPESLIVITGCVVNADPDTEPAAAVVTASCVAAPTVGVIVCVVVKLEGEEIV